MQTSCMTKDVINHEEILQLTISQAKINLVYLSYIEWFLKRVIVIAYTAALSETELCEVKSASIIRAAQIRVTENVI